jgi:hypothetical protein
VRAPSSGGDCTCERVCDWDCSCSVHHGAQVRIEVTPRHSSGPDLARDPVWLIWSCEHQIWWAAGECGYTTQIEHAGRYTLQAGLRACERRSRREDGKPNEILVPSPELLERIRQ